MLTPENIEHTTEIINSSKGLISALQGFLEQLLISISAVIAASSVAAKYLPPPDQPGFLSKVHKWINAAAFNSGYATNAEAKKDGD
jgi:hypothetical protein